MVTIRVVSKNTGKPHRGSRVSLGFDGLFRGVSSGEYTDSEGEAHFDVDPGDGQVYVDGKSRFRGRLAGRVIVYV